MGASYKSCLTKDHPRANSQGRVLEHILIAEERLGEYLPKEAVVHHVDKNPLNNDSENLIVCKDYREHMLLHRRQEAYDACRNMSWRRCNFCQRYDDPKNLYICPSDHCSYHRECRNEYRRGRRDFTEIIEWN